VTLSATIKDITAVAGDLAYDPNGGDIRNAKVSFVNKDNGMVLCPDLVPALVSSSDPLVGTVSCQTKVLGSGNQGATPYSIGIVVGGFYTATEESTVIEVAQPIGTGFITGGGYLVNPTNTAGTYAPDRDRKTNFGFNVKYNKSGTNLQGNVNIIFRRGTQVYQIKSNALSSLGVKYSTAQGCSTNATPTCPITATFQGKSNLADVTGATPVSLGGNLVLQMALTDKGEPGSADTLAISLYDGSKLLFSSQWDGTRTVEQLLKGGNLVAH
jgi:hypothetical protein